MKYIEEIGRNIVHSAIKVHKTLGPGLLESVYQKGSQCASLCVELDVASCGRTKKDALDGLKRAVETYIEYMVSEGREKEIYRPVPMNELKTFLFPEHQTEEKTFKAIPLSFQYA